MPRFLIEAWLTAQGVQGAHSEGGSARREAVGDNESAAAMALAVNSSAAVTISPSCSSLSRTSTPR
jgi:hypothetical protein